jgi:hypothetical protein
VPIFFRLATCSTTSSTKKLNTAQATAPKGLGIIVEKNANKIINAQLENKNSFGTDFL